MSHLGNSVLSAWGLWAGLPTQRLALLWGSEPAVCLSGSGISVGQRPRSPVWSILSYVFASSSVKEDSPFIISSISFLPVGISPSTFIIRFVYTAFLLISSSTYYLFSSNT